MAYILMDVFPHGEVGGSRRLGHLVTLHPIRKQREMNALPALLAFRSVPFEDLGPRA